MENSTIELLKHFQHLMMMAVKTLGKVSWTFFLSTRELSQI